MLILPHTSESVDRSFERLWIRVLCIQINLQRRNWCKFTCFPGYTLDTSLSEIFALFPISQAADTAIMFSSQPPVRAQRGGKSALRTLEPQRYSCGQAICP